MSSYYWPRPATAQRCARLRRFRLPAALAAIALLAQGCAQTPNQPFDGANAADADVRVPPVAYRSVLDGYVSRRPVSPSPWTEQNRQVAPAPEKGGR